MLRSSLLILLLLNIFINNLLYIGTTTLILFILNLIYNRNLKENIQRVRFLFFFYFLTCLLQIFYTQEGEVLFKFLKFYITKEGIYNFLLNFLRIFNLLLLFWIVVEQKFIGNKFSKYQKIIELVIELVPQAILLIRKRMRIKWFFRYILKQIKVKN
ncbi:CbiQ family ECF transporter T component [Fusobacterium necrogenes]|uniref:CbiQ family ECF transporter T component n=1 Tax=Fusobacterium necrogenes TaxID=858 RepID=UPI00255CFD46|nr:CbiQ family ECF transporter T component [Fusobacterium necrogenes]